MFKILYSRHTIDNECMCGMEREREWVLSFAGGFVSYTPLWNGSTDFHTHCETVTKLEKEVDGDRNRKIFSLEDFLFLFLPLLLSLFVFLLLSFHLCFSAAAC